MARPKSSRQSSSTATTPQIRGGGTAEIETSKRKRGRPLSSTPKASPKKAVLQQTAVAPIRQSKRGRPAGTSNSSQTTPKKSQYFEQSAASSVLDSEIEKEASGYEDEDESASLVSSPPESEEDEDEEGDHSSDSNPPKRRKLSKKAPTKLVRVTNTAKGQELWRPGVKAPLAPGEEIFIKLPKARPAGKIPYTDSTLHPNTFLFLGDLAANNDREWLKIHDADFRQAERDFDSFVQCLTEKLMESDDTIPELPPKDLKFRIYRDVRFSHDPTPYKTHFSAGWSRTGRKGPYAHYYVQVKPGGSFVGGGCWCPEADPLAALRRNVDRKSRKLKAVLMDQRLQKEFWGVGGKNTGKAVKAFVANNKENMLKTKPKGYGADNPNIDILRLRNWTIGRKMKDEQVLGKQGLGKIAELMGALTPFITYLNSVIMPDEDSSDEEVGSEGEENEEEDEDR